MIPPGTGTLVAGVRHGRAGNSSLPAQWLLYFVVEDLDRSIESRTEAGGELLPPVRNAGSGRYRAIKDPAGAVCAIYQP